MNINLLPIVSPLHDDGSINNETRELIDQIEQLGDFTFQLTKAADFYSADLSLILVQSGGSEGYFLRMEKDLKPPYYLLTYGSNNSLAASMEILSYLKAKGKPAEILHGSATYIAGRLKALGKKHEQPPVRLGVVGHPSDWLIASNVDYETSRFRLGIELVDIDINELIELYHSVDISGYEDDLDLVFSQTSVDQAKRVSKALRMLVERYNLKGLTLRCFDLLDSIHTTGCLGLSLLNRDRIIGTCEGDIPAMISMYLLNTIAQQPGFQANPSRIDSDKNEIVFAHCTIPIDMVESYQAMTHFESGIGVGLRGKMRETDVTLFKLSHNLKDYYVAEGRLLTNLEEDNLCRTQVVVQLDDVSYFLTHPYGNHHLVVYGKHKEAIERYMERYT